MSGRDDDDNALAQARRPRRADARPPIPQFPPPVQPQGGGQPPPPVQPQGGGQPPPPVQPQGGGQPPPPVQPQGGGQPPPPVQPQGGGQPPLPVQPQGGLPPLPVQPQVGGQPPPAQNWGGARPNQGAQARAPGLGVGQRVQPPPVQPQGGGLPPPVQPQGGGLPPPPVQPQGGGLPPLPVQPQGGGLPPPVQPQGGGQPPAQNWGGARPNQGAQARAPGLGVGQRVQPPPVQPQGGGLPPVQAQGGGLPPPVQPPVQAVPQPTIMPVANIPPNVAQWTAQMLQVLGWNSKRVDQGNLNTEIGTRLAAQPQPLSPLMADLSQKHAGLAANFGLNGVWSNAEEMQAAEIKATLAFEAMPNKKAELQGGSANPTFWVRGAADPTTGETREYIFKPATNYSLMSGIPEGGEPAREALASRVSEQLRVFTGTDFKVPTTNVISVDTERLDGYTGGELKPGAVATGSLQEFSASGGDMRGAFCRQKGNVTDQSCQNIAILDTIMLNMDRHDGNLLLEPGGTGLIPIDHGLCFPTATTIKADSLATNMAGDKNVLLRLPNSYEPFTQASLAALGEIDPDLMTAALQSEVRKMEQVKPGTEDSIPKDSLTISNLSTKFLKKAAPTLSPALIQIVLGVHNKELLDPALARDPVKWDQTATALITRYAAKAAPIKEYWLLSAGERDALLNKLKADKFITRIPPEPLWLYDHIDLIMSYVQSGTASAPAVVPPAAQVADLDAQQTKDAIWALLPKLKLDAKKSAEWIADWKRVRRAGSAAEIDYVVRDANAKFNSLKEVLTAVQAHVAAQDSRRDAAKLSSLAVTFPNMPPLDPTDVMERIRRLDAWDMFLRNGGAQALRAARLRLPAAPAPNTPTEATMLILSLPPDVNRIVTQRLDFLDGIVQADATMVTAPNRAALTHMRRDLAAGQLQQPQAAVAQLASEIVADGVDALRARLTALERRMSEDDWDRSIKMQWMPTLLTGDVLGVLPEVRRLEGSLPAQNIR